MSNGIKIQALSKFAKLPTQATSGAAAWDLYAAQDVVLLKYPLTNAVLMS